MQKKRTLTILASVLFVVALLASLAVATYALFSDSMRIGNRLEAGTLQIELWRTNLTYTDYAAEGGVSSVEDDVNLVEDGEEQVFRTENFFPGMKQTATLEIRNKGSLPFTYNLAFTIAEDEGEEGTAAADEEPTLADYILVTVTQGETECGSKTLAELAAGDAIEVGSMDGTENEVQSFDVTIEFVDEEADNSMQGASVEFDILVTATQNTSAPETDGATE